jgi:HD-GYP domain-containing protein (c-di-GMP phosphodiesterase class II)
MDNVDSQPQDLAQQEQVSSKFIPIPLESLRLDTEVNFKIYVITEQEKEPVLYRAENLQFTEAVRKRLQENDVRRVYIETSDRDEYWQYVEHNLDNILADDGIDPQKKAEVVYSSATQLIEHLFENPWMREGIRRSEKLVESTAYFLLHDETAFSHFLSVRSYDYYTYTHSVNVYVFSVALADKVGIGEMSDIVELGTGALLHDVGMSLVDSRIVNKSGPLTTRELAAIKKHPTYGMKVLREAGGISEDCLAVVSQHHERCDGSGYPEGFSEKNIHPYARLAAVVDVFDAMTTQRLYGEALNSFTAFLTMKNEMRAGLDQNMFREFVQLMAE